MAITGRMQPTTFQILIEAQEKGIDHYPDAGGV